MNDIEEKLSKSRLFTVLAEKGPDKDSQLYFFLKNVELLLNLDHIQL